VDLSFDEDQRRLAATARRVLTERAGSAQLRRTLESPEGFDAELWKQLGQLGWTGITVPEAYGGLGLGPIELTAVMEEMGRALLCSPFFSSIALAMNVVLALEDEAQRARHLPQLASGELRGALAYAEAGVEGTWPHAKASAHRQGAAFVLNGEKSYVLDGQTADRLIVALRLDGEAALFAVETDATGVHRTALRTLDPTRRQARIALRDVRVAGEALLASGAAAERALSRALDLATIALAAEQVGGAERCLDMALEHARTRHQFGRPIGSFQAIKHLCADMLTQLETARSGCYYAAAAASRSDARSLAQLAAISKVCCSEAYFFCAAQSIQIHGGMGFTWEHDAQLHFKRARSSMALLGEPALYRERTAACLLD